MLKKKPMKLQSNQVHKTNSSLEAPFPRHLSIQKHHTQVETDLPGQLKDVGIKTPLIQSITR